MPLTYYVAFVCRTGTPTGSALMPHIDAFKHSLQEKMTEIGIRNGWKHDSYKRSFLIQEVRSVDCEERNEVGWWVSSPEVLGRCLSLRTCSPAVSGVWGTHSRSCELHNRDGWGESSGPDSAVEAEDARPASSHCNRG